MLKPLGPSMLPFPWCFLMNSRCLNTQMRPGGASLQFFLGSIKKGVWARRRCPAPSTAASVRCWWWLPLMLRGSCASFKSTRRPGSLVRWLTSNLVRQRSARLILFAFLDRPSLNLTILWIACAHAGGASVVVRNLQQSLLNVEAVCSGELGTENPGCHGDGTTPRKRKRVGVLISGTGVLQLK